ncbi:MAG: hypothetical protein R3272_15500, partial [Candidatus Promineifilaceae bacterium]|nr:hypothetical protein [Candidatus Promineifilaceae bacterium]
MMRFHSPKYLLILTLVLAAVVVFLVGSAPTYSADHNLVHSELDSQQTSCRYGSAAPPDDVWVDELGIGWTIDFGASPRPFLPDVEYVPIIRIKQSRSMDDTRIADYYLTSPPSEERLVELLERFPGRIWQVGNEVDRIWWQDDIMPDVYATAYHELYHLIKKHDPTALVAPSALVQVTPGRLQYLDIVWDTYQEKYGAEMPVDVWNMHIYILPERSLTNPGSGSRAGIALGTDPDLAIYDSGNSPDPALCPRDDVYCYAEHDSIEIFKEQAIAMRRWMKERGEQDKPLILTEFSILYPYKEETDPDYDPETCPDCFSLQDEYGEVFSRTRVLEYMNQTLNFLETATDPELGYPEDNYRLVQQWNWFSVYSVTPGSP